MKGRTTAMIQGGWKKVEEFLDGDFKQFEEALGLKITRQNFPGEIE